MHGSRIRHAACILQRCGFDDVIDTLLSYQTRCVRIRLDDSYSIAHLEIFVQSLEVTYKKASRIASLTILLIFLCMQFKNSKVSAKKENSCEREEFLLIL